MAAICDRLVCKSYLFRLSTVMCIASALIWPASVLAESDGGAFKVTETWKIGGEGRWDYAICDSAAKRLYVTRQTHVQVIDESNGKVISDIKDTAGCHGVALAPDLGRGYVSNGQAGTITVFDLKTGQTLGSVPAEKNPDCILFDPASKKVFAFNGRSNSATVIDASAEPGPKAVVATIPLPGKPEFAAADGSGHVYVNIEDKDSIVAIDSNAMKVSAAWKIDGAEEPSGLAIDAAHHRLFAGCGNQVMAIVDAESGKTLGTVPIGKGVDACGFDPGTGQAFASCGDGTLTVVKATTEGKFAVEQTVQTRRGARTMALDAATHTIYLPAAEFAPVQQNERRPTAIPGSFMIVVVAPAQK